MKNHLLTISFSLFISFLWAQNSQLDSLHIFDYLDDWELETVYNYDYSSGQNSSIVIYDIDQNGNRNLSSRQTYQYNENGDWLEIIFQDYDGMGVYTNTGKREYTYDANYNGTGDYYYNWDDVSGEWVKDFGSEQASFDAQGNYGIQFLLRGDDNNQWEEVKIYTREYYYNPDETLDSFTIKEESSIYQAFAYEYNSDGNQIKNRRYTSTSDGFNISGRMERSYNSLNLLDSLITYLYNFEGLEYIFQELTYTYDDQENLMCRVEGDYATDVYFERKLQYFYPMISSVVTLDQLGLKVNWTNANLGKLDISLEGLDSSKYYSLGIFNMQGQKVKSLKISNLSEWSNDYRSNAGSYFLVIQDQDGIGYTEKMVVF